MPVVSLYGLRVRCAIPLPGPRADGADADVEVRLAERPPGAEAFADEGAPLVYASEHAPGETPALVADLPAGDALLRLRYAEGIRFHVSAAGDVVWCEWRSPLTESDVVSFLVGPVMGSILRRRGVLALHASAVVMGGGAWAFLGPGGSGKSTLAAALARAGHPVLTEDLLALRPAGKEWIAAPGYPAIRLWDDSAAMVSPEVALPPLTPTWPKRDLALDARALPFASAPAPLRGVIVLDDYGAPGDPPRLRRIPASEARVELVANVYANYVATPPELGRELGLVTLIAAAVPGWRFAPAAGAGGLSESCTWLESLVNG